MEVEIGAEVEEGTEVAVEAEPEAEPEEGTEVAAEAAVLSIQHISEEYDDEDEVLLSPAAASYSPRFSAAAGTGALDLEELDRSIIDLDFEQNRDKEADPEGRAVRETVSEEQRALLLRLLSLLYCRQAFREFRRPVPANHPHLAGAYHAAVRHPVDLGSLFVLVHHGMAGVQRVRLGLQRVALNTLEFNVGYAVFEATARHLDHTASTLFEELLGVPYYSETTPKMLRTHVSTIVSAADTSVWQSHIRDERSKRFELLKTFPLSVTEVENLLTFFAPQQWEKFTATQTSMVATIYADISALLRTTTLMDGQPMVRVFPRDVYFAEVLRPLFRSLPSSSTPSASLLVDMFAPDHGVDEQDLTFYKSMERELAIFSVFVVERIFRGDLHTTCWAIPDKQFVWTQLGKDSKGRNPWWPCMIIVSNCKEYPMNSQVMKKNIERIPTDFIKGLIKLRPRLTLPRPQLRVGQLAEEYAEEVNEDAAQTAEIDSSVLASHGDEPLLTAYYDHNPAPVEEPIAADDKRRKPKMNPPLPTIVPVPDNYLILEYFGQHDLGWKRADQTLRIEGAGINYPGVGYKIANNTVLAEFESAYAQILGNYRCHKEPKESEKDLEVMPPIEQVEELIFVPPNLRRSQFKAQQFAKKKEVTVLQLTEKVISGRKKNPKAKKSDVVDVNGVILTHVTGPSKLKQKDIKALPLEKAIVNGEFFVSRCPLPVQVEPDIIAPTFHTKIGLNVRRNAIVRTRAMIHWLSKIHPKNFNDGESQPLLQSLSPGVVDGLVTRELINGMGVVLNRERVQPPQSLELEDSRSTPANVVDEEAGQSTSVKRPRKLSTKKLASVADADPNLPLKVNFLERGCSRYLCGTGIFHRRVVDMSDALFFKENFDQEERIKILRLELNTLTSQIDELQFEIDSAKLGAKSDLQEEVDSLPVDDDSQKQPKSTSRTAGQRDSLHNFAKLILPGKVGLLAQKQLEKREREETASEGEHKRMRQDTEQE